MSEQVKRVERMLPLGNIYVDRPVYTGVLNFVAAFRNGVECRPIKVQWDEDKRMWRVKDGRHRYMAMKLMGATFIPVRHAPKGRAYRPKKKMVQRLVLGDPSIGMDTDRFRGLNKIPPTGRIAEAYARSTAWNRLVTPGMVQAEMRRQFGDK